MFTPSYEQFCQKAKEGNLVPVYREILADTETPVSAFLKIAKGPYAFLLESVEGGEKWGRYSFLGINPSLIVQAEGGRVTLTRGDQTETLVTDGNPLGVLQKVLSGFQPVRVDGLPRFFGGAVGYIAYEAVRFFEPVALKAPSIPDFTFLIAGTLLIFDNVRHRIQVVSNVLIRDADLSRHYQEALTAIEAVIAMLRGPLVQTNTDCAIASSPAPLPTAGAAGANVTREQFKASVLRAQEYIKAGDIFQVQLSQRFTVPITCSPFSIYRALRVINPSPYMFYLQMGQRCLAGSSPEVLVRLEDGDVTIRPIAGTRRRGQTPAEDRAMEAELLADPKERAEHLMLVDLGRNDIGRVCAYGTVAVDALMVIERYSHVMHIVSNIVGKIEQGRNAFDLLAACFPAGTVTGAPKIRAMEIINTLETEGRGVYAGAVGYFGFDGNMDTCIAIRTVVIENGMAYVQAAAGIVADSLPDAEYEETVNKSRAMLAAIQMAEQGFDS
jgi:anthranilate synthase component 1